MKRTPLKSLLALILAAVLMVQVFPATVQAKKSSSEIQKELNGLKDQNKEIQAQINAIQRSRT